MVRWLTGGNLINMAKHYRQAVGAMALPFFKLAFIFISVVIGLYGTLLGLLTTETFQSHVVYLTALEVTWFNDLNIPESFSFLQNRATPFFIETLDGGRLYA